MSERIQLAHGGGGTLMQQLIERELKPLYNDPAEVLHDAASFTVPAGQLAAMPALRNASAIDPIKVAERSL